MPFNLGTPTSQDYDYTSSGIDAFLNRSIDQVTWQTTLDAVLNYPGNETLTTLPGQPNSNTLNLNATQITGAQGTITQNGSTVSNPDGAVVTYDANGNAVLQIGTLA